MICVNALICFLNLVKNYDSSRTPNSKIMIGDLCLDLSLVKQ